MPSPLQTRKIARRIATAEYLASSVDKVFYTALSPMRVKGIKHRVTVAGTDAGAVTAMVEKVIAGTAIGSGVDLHQTTFNLKSAADTVTDGVLVTTSASLDLEPGDSLAVDFTGVLTSATGAISVLLEPR